MSTIYRRGDIVMHRDSNARGIVNVGTDSIGLTVVSWMTGGTDTLPAVDLLAAQPHIRRGDIVLHRDTNTRGIVTNVVSDDVIEVRWWDAEVIAGAIYALDVDVVRRRHYSPAIDAMIDGWDGGDVWGSAMSMAWAVAEVARAAEIESNAAPVDHVELDRVPQILEVSWGAAQPMTIDEMADVEGNPEDRGDVSFETSMLAAAYRDGRVTDADLLFAARVLDRYLDIARAAGQDY